MTSSPTSTNSGCLSCVTSEDTSEDQFLPSSLAAEELLLALNKEANANELQKAIARCKELVLECDNLSVERKWLVRHLIELRLRLQECKEALLDPEHPWNKSSGASRRAIRGHHLNLQPLLSRTKYCDHCTGQIWHLIQAWYQCEDCGYSCHYKCLSDIVRECAHVTASEKGGYEFDICPEKGLSAQKYKCAECGTNLPVGLRWAESEAKRCDYTGLYYCSACHWGSQAVIPARLMHNWDFQPQPVSQASLQLLKITASRPLINLEKLNPKIFGLVHELSLVKRIRGELNQMRKYLLVCRLAQQDHFMWKKVGMPHLIESPDLYSIQDLVDTHSGELPSLLLNLASTFTQHIKQTCEVCKGRGHICEICSNDEIVYPFDNTAAVCKDCNAVLHKTCFAKRKNECPKCKRISMRREQESVLVCSDEENVL